MERPINGVIWTIALLAGVAIALASASHSFIGALMGGGDPQPWPVMRWQLIYWISWGILAPFVVQLSSRHLVMRPFSRQHLAMHVLGAAAFHIFHVGFQVFAMRILPAYVELHGGTLVGAYLWHVTDSIYLNTVTFIAIASITHLAVYHHRYRQKEIDSAKLESALVQAQLQTLRMQLQPHFLFNTLHSISTLMHRDVAAAESMLVQLSDLLRMTVEEGGSQVVTLSEEIAFVRKYLDIEKVRFGDRLTIEYDLDESMLQEPVPTFILQPLVENAVRHGISTRSGPGTVRIRAHGDNKSVILSIEDNGRGLPESGYREGVGLTNTRQRLRQMYGSVSSLVVENSQPSGVRCEIRFPRKAVVGTD